MTSNADPATLAMQEVAKRTVTVDVTIGKESRTGNPVRVAVEATAGYVADCAIISATKKRCDDPAIDVLPEHRAMLRDMHDEAKASARDEARSLLKRARNATNSLDRSAALRIAIRAL